MSKKLSEMTLEELWQLFPIFLVPHNPEWKTWFNQEKTVLENLLCNMSIIRIEHIGSTTIPEIHAKNIVDILIEIDDNHFDQAVDVLNNNGYILMNNNQASAAFNKGYTEDGFAEEVFHFHLRKKFNNDELYFRDYLIAFPKVAKEYEQLKLQLWKKYVNDRDGYTRAKTEFINDKTNKAKALYKGKY